MGWIANKVRAGIMIDDMADDIEKNFPYIEIFDRVTAAAKAGINTKENYQEYKNAIIAAVSIDVDEWSLKIKEFLDKHFEKMKAAEIKENYLASAIYKATAVVEEYTILYETCKSSLEVIYNEEQEKSLFESKLEALKKANVEQF